MHEESLDDRVLFSRADLKAMGIPWSRQYIYRMEAAGRFPKHIPLGEKTNAWKATDVRDWLAARLGTPSAQPTNAT